MKSRLYSAAAVIAFSFLVAATASAQTNAVLLGKYPAHPGRLLARFKADASPLAQAQVLEAAGYGIRRAIPLVPGLVVLEQLPKVRALAAPPAARPQKDTALVTRIKDLMASGQFDYVEPDYYVKAYATPTDAAYNDGRLWGLRNTGSGGGVAGADIGAAAAWDITNGSTNIIVAVIDTGIRNTHVDLSAQVWVNPGEIAGNGTDDDGDGYVDNMHGINSIIGRGNPVDDNDHGTHVAGTIGAAANNAGEHVGVAWNVRLMGCKFLDANGSGLTSDAIECINFAVNNGAKILNNSWGGGPFQQSLFDSINGARTAGALFVAAAGNESRNNDANPSYPASYALDNIISVAAVDRANGLASFSNIGAQSVHLGAPGVDIFSCVKASDTAYDSLNGTSMAAPHVSGAAVLVWARFPTATVNEVRQRLLDSVVPIPSLAGKTTTGGRLNVLNAMSAGADNILEIDVTSTAGNILVAGSTVTVIAQVSDLFAVNNATVTGSVAGGSALSFFNNGTGPDITASDNLYSASLTVPSSASTITIDVQIMAPGKTNGNASAQFSVVLPPGNDSFVGRTPIQVLPATVAGNNADATPEAGEPSPMDAGGGKTLWWSWTALQSGIYSVSTGGSTFDTVLGVYKGTSLLALTVVGENDDTGSGLTSEVIFQATAGTIYQILVDGYGGSTGNIQLNLSASPPITNDNFANRKTISGIDVTVTSSSFGSTSQSLEPDLGPFPAEKTVWWSWTSPVSASVAISTGGSSFDTILAVFTGPAVPTLATLTPVPGGEGIGWSDDVVTGLDNTSLVRFPAVAGTTYHVVVDGNLDATGTAIATGNIELSIARKPANDNFATRALLSGAFAEATAFTLRATHETGEPLFDSRLLARTVWWSWTAPWTGKATITTINSTFDTVLSVYTGSAFPLSLVADNDDAAPPNLLHSQVSFQATAGTPYQIQVDGYYDDFWFPEVLSGKATVTITLDGASSLKKPTALSNGSVGVELIGEVERPYVLSASTNMLNWSNVATNTLIGRRFLFLDPGASLGVGNWFYRAQPATLISTPAPRR